jgi:serine/threonine protein kinase
MEKSDRGYHDFVIMGNTEKGLSNSMLKTVEAIIDEDGNVRLLETVQLAEARRALVTILEEPAFSRTTTVHTSEPEPNITDWNAQYNPIKTIGRGGMGETFLAEDRHTGKIVCVKTLISNVDTRSLQQECRALAKLNHPSIVRLLNFETGSRTPYLVMEFVKGPTLADFMKRNGVIIEPVATGLALRLFEALAYAHQEEVIHCDLKPNNIILIREGLELVPKILDFRSCRCGQARRSGCRYGRRSNCWNTRLYGS